MCKQCGETVGWKYDKAYEASEKYKVSVYSAPLVYEEGNTRLPSIWERESGSELVE